VAARAELPKALELLKRAQAEVVAEAEAEAMWQTRAELLAIQLQQTQERILALEAPREPTPVETPSGEPTNGPPVEISRSCPRSRRAWWRFW
jgi:hypothetical protein